MSFSWRNSLRTCFIGPIVQNKSNTSLEFEYSNLPIYTQILNYEQNLKKMILNVFFFLKNFLQRKKMKFFHRKTFFLSPSGFFHSN